MRQCLFLFSIILEKRLAKNILQILFKYWFSNRIEIIMVRLYSK